MCKKELCSIAARGRQQLLRANQAELRRLLRPEGVLAAFAAREGKQRDVGMQTSRQIRQHRSRFVVWMRRDV